MFVNFHTHNELDTDVIGILNVDDIGQKRDESALYSLGIHPWKSIDNSWSYNINNIFEQSKNKEIVAIGECGYDNIKGVSQIQDSIFRVHIEISEVLKKPLIIHSVGTHHKILEAKKKHSPTQKWVLHSVIANKEMGRQFINENLYCSFSFRSLQNLKTIELFKSYPIHLIFLETDNSTIPIDKIYQFAAQILKCDEEVLKAQLYSNFIEFIGESSIH